MIDSWRPNQEENISDIVRGEERVTVTNAPTGFGKSPTYMGVAKALGKRTCIVTPSRGLQDQLMKGYASMGLVDLRGRANYACDLKEDYTCEEGFAARCPYKGTVGCPASQAEMRAAAAPYVVTNYKKWTASKKFGMGMENFEVVIFDEAHHMTDALADALQVILHFREIEQDLGLSFPGGSDADNMEEWKKWASAARVVSEVQMVQALARIAGVHDPKPSHVKHYTHMRNLMRRLATLATMRPSDWVVDDAMINKKHEGYQFDPIRPGRYGESHLLMRVPRVLAYSATIRPKTCFQVGLAKDKFTYREYPSDFDPKRCPTYYIPTQAMSKNHAHDLSRFYNRLDQILAPRMDRKGLIQTFSYERRTLITDASRFQPVMLINEQGESVTAAVESFLDAPPPMYLVSPSVGEGFDFAMKAAEVNVICKLPFEPPSKIGKAREEDDREYAPYRCMNKLVQALGRIVRSKEDQGENFITDNDIEWFRPRYGHLAPKTFHQFFQQVKMLPRPLPRL